ncbi:MAG TPA: hypothetical protein VMZ22_01875 [Acidimicrobiales bacterium]|nr:hypothetical protein [Acidimicrobiales bacterium]
MTLRLVVVAALVAGWSALGVGVAATYNAHTTADEPEYLMTALSLAEDRSLDVSDERLARRYRPFHKALLPVQAQRRSDGSRISPHDPLLAAVLALPMALGGWIAAKLMLAALAGLLAAVTLWTSVRRFALAERTATITVLAFAGAAPLSVYGTQVYPELPAALAVVTGIACLTGRHLQRATVLGAIATVVALPWLAVKYAPVSAVLAAWLLVQLWRDGSQRRRLGWVIVVFAVAGATYLAAHQAWYGGWTVYAAGDHFVAGEFSVVGNAPNPAGRSVRLVGLLVDRNFGLAVWQPLYLAAPVAFGALARVRPPGWALLSALVAAGWLNATFVALTMHGYWWPGRQLVVVLPAVVLAVAWVAAGSSLMRNLIVLGGLVGAVDYGWLLVEGYAGRATWVVDFFDTTNPLVRVPMALLPDYQRSATADWALHACWTLLVVALGLAAYRRARIRVT